MVTQTVKIEDIIIPEIRSNAVYSPEKWIEFVESVKASGIQYKPSVRRLPDGRTELVDGLHRIKAWKELGHIDIEVELETLTDEQAFVKHVVANHHRGENDPVGLSKIIKQLKDGGKSLEDIGKLIGYSGSQTAQYAQLAYLPDAYQQAVSQGKLKLAHIREAVRLEDPREIDAALTYTLQMCWTADVLHHYVQNRVDELTRASQGGDPSQAGMIQPPAPNPQLAQYRTCLICGALGEAHEMFYPALGKECHDALEYLKQIDKNPWNALQILVGQNQSLEQDVAAGNQKIKELSDRLIDLSLRLMPGVQPNAQQYNPAAAPTPAGVRIPDIQSQAQNR